MFGISGEHLLVLLVILLIFGPKRLPDLGHSLGRTLKNFRDGMAGGNSHGTHQPSSGRPTSHDQIAQSQSASGSPSHSTGTQAGEKNEEQKQPSHIS